MRIAEESMTKTGYEELALLSLSTADYTNIVPLVAQIREKFAAFPGTFVSFPSTRIDALITKKTRFIELLKEKRHALIDHAVTKGLNAEARMQNSGVEWLGEIPAHWEVRRMASIFREAIRPGDQSLPSAASIC